MRIALPHVVFLLVMVPAAPAQVLVEKPVPELVMDLRSIDPRVRLNALLVLADSPVQGEKAVPAIAKLLGDGVPAIRLQAVKTLSAYGKDGAAAAPALIKSLTDSDPMVRSTAAEVLRQMGEDLAPALRDVLKEGAPAIRLAVLQLVEAMAMPPAELLPVLAPLALKDPQTPIRRAAFMALVKMGPENEDAMKILAQTVRDRDTPLRVAAVGVLLNAGKEHWEHLAKAMDDPVADVRLSMVQALGSKVDELDEVHVKALRKGLEDADVRVRLTAVTAVANMQIAAREKGGGKDMFSAVAKLASDPDPAVRRSAIWALGQIGIDDADELAVLAKGMKGNDPQLRGLTVQALAQYLHEDTPEKFRTMIGERLADGLRDPDRRVQSVAAEILSKEGPAALPVLMQVMEKGGGNSRLWAAYLLGELGVEARAALPLLEKMARESTPEGRLVARAAIQKINM